MKELSEAVDKGDAEEEHRIDVEIRDVMTMRKEIARDMGERTLSTPDTSRKGYIIIVRFGTFFT